MCRKSSFVLTLIALLILIGCSPSDKIESMKYVEVNNAKAIPNPLVKQEEQQQPHFFLDFKLDQAIAEEQKGSNYPYFKLTSNYKNQLSGTFYIENTQQDTEIVLVVMQGRETTLLRQNGEKEWNKSLVLNSKKGSTIDLKLDIKWDQDKSDELIVFPFIKSSTSFYSGSHYSLIRLFVGDNKEYTFTEKELLSKKIVRSDDLKLASELLWVDNDFNEVKTLIKDNKFFAEKKYNKLLISSLTNDTNVDVIYLNTLGESEVLLSNYTLQKNKKAVITIEDEKMDKYFGIATNQFLLVLNNKDNDMLLDIMAVNEGINPVSTSFQRIIELIPY